MQRTTFVRLGHYTTAILLHVAFAHMAISLSAESGKLHTSPKRQRGQTEIHPSLARRVCVRPPHAPKPACRTEVLIYYANETAPHGTELESWETILGWLDSSDKPDERVAGVERSEPSETLATGGSLRSTPGTLVPDSPQFGEEPLSWAVTEDKP